MLCCGIGKREIFFINVISSCISMAIFFTPATLIRNNQDVCNVGLFFYHHSFTSHTPAFFSHWTRTFLGLTGCLLWALISQKSLKGNDEEQTYSGWFAHLYYHDCIRHISMWESDCRLISSHDRWQFIALQRTGHSNSIKMLLLICLCVYIQFTLSPALLTSIAISAFLCRLQFSRRVRLQPTIS